MNRFGLLGEKLSHSYSPEIHSLLADYEYKLYEKAPAELDAFFKDCPLDGMNVTIPYKKDVIKYCADLSDAARLIGSVNTIVKRDGGYYGDNTDYYGFDYMVKKSGVVLADTKTLVLGSGGAAQTVIKHLEASGVREIIVVSRSGENNYTNIDRHYDADVIVNTTPVGMYPNVDASPVEIASFKSLKGVLDLIYNPATTRLLMQAKVLGIPCINGLSMLVAQAQRACELFTGENIDDGVIDGIVKKLEGKMKNIVLIGMPGCGKSTVSAMLGKELSREVFDADTQVEQDTGMKIPYIIETEGEKVFREHETETLKKLCKLSGKIIATGGGCVTIPENYNILHQNSIVIWLKRDLSRLATEGRPLTAKNGLENLYENRRALYERFADYTVDNNGTAKETVEKILEILK